MLKKTFLLMLSVFAILPFAGQVSAATQDAKASDDLAWFWNWGRGYYGGCGYGGCGYSGCGYSGCYNSYSYYPYSYGCGYGCY